MFFFSIKVSNLAARVHHRPHRRRRAPKFLTASAVCSQRKQHGVAQRFLHGMRRSRPLCAERSGTPVVTCFYACMHACMYSR